MNLNISLKVVSGALWTRLPVCHYNPYGGTPPELQVKSPG